MPGRLWDADVRLPHGSGWYSKAALLVVRLACHDRRHTQDMHTRIGQLQPCNTILLPAAVAPFGGA